MVPQSQTKRSTPQLDQLFASMRYFSPTKRTDQNQMIDTIRSLGSQILQSSPNSPQFQLPIFIDETIQSTSNILRASISPRPFHSTKMPKQSTPLRPAKNLYDKYKQDYIVKKEKKLFNRTQQIYNDISQNQNPTKFSKGHQHIVKKLYENNNVNSLNYEKFINKKVRKDAEQKTYLNKTLKESIKIQKQQQAKAFPDKKLQSSMSNAIRQDRKTLYQKSEQARRLKQHNLNKRRQEIEKNQMQGVTFFPEKIAKKQVRRDLSKQQRERVTSLRKQFKQYKILKQVIQKTPFTPKLNRDDSIESKIRSLWSSGDNASRRQLRQSKSKRVQTSTNANDRSLMTELSVKNTDEIKFLLH